MKIGLWNFKLGGYNMTLDNDEHQMFHDEV
jgi:hypothetical protein